MANEQNLIPAKKGEVRNPKGKPKGTLHISTHIKQMLEDENFEMTLKDGTIFKGRPMQAIIKTAVIKAAEGDMRAFDMLGKYGYGTSLDVTSNGETLPTVIIEGVYATDPKFRIDNSTAEADELATDSSTKSS
jgi:hypothetical protein